jgi:hypothetical protein
MSEPQVNVQAVVESLVRQIADYAQKVALLEAQIVQLQAVQGNEKAD